MTSVIAPQTLGRNLLSFCTSHPKQDEVEKGFFFIDAITCRRNLAPSVKP